MSSNLSKLNEMKFGQSNTSSNCFSHTFKVIMEFQAVADVKENFVIFQAKGWEKEVYSQKEITALPVKILDQQYLNL